MALIRSWKKVYEVDLSNMAIELKEVITTPAVIFLDGPVGAGKTSFCKIFIGKSEVQSPTYSLVNEYDNILHADLYRLEKKEDLIHLELPMYIEDKEYFLIEWGMTYQHSIEKLISEEFKYYQLKIDINPENNQHISSRNYSLFKL